MYCLLFGFYEVCNETDDYGYYDYGYEVCCGLGEWDVPLWYSVRLYGVDFGESVSLGICSFYVE